MKERRINFEKGLQMNLACANDDYRPMLSFIYFEKGYAYASDGYILVRNNVRECSTIPDEQVDILNGKLIHRDIWKEIIKYPCIEVSEDGIEASRNIEKTFFYFSSINGKYPNAEKVLQDACNMKSIPLSEVGLRTDLLIKLNKALHGSDKCCYQFKGADKGVILQSIESDNIGMIVPFEIITT